MICKNNSQNSAQPSALSPSSNTPKSNQNIVKSVSMCPETIPQNNRPSMLSDPLKQSVNSTNGHQASAMKCLHIDCDCSSYSSYKATDTDSSSKQRTCLNCKHSWTLHGKLTPLFYCQDNIHKLFF